MEKLLNNIHGTDAALLAICFVMWQLNTTRKLDTQLATYTITCMTILGGIIVVGRCILSLIHSYRIKLESKISAQTDSTLKTTVARIEAEQIAAAELEENK